MTRRRTRSTTSLNYSPSGNTWLSDNRIDNISIVKVKDKPIRDINLKNVGAIKGGYLVTTSKSSITPKIFKTKKQAENYIKRKI